MKIIIDNKKIVIDGEFDAVITDNGDGTRKLVADTFSIEILDDWDELLVTKMVFDNIPPNEVFKGGDRQYDDCRFMGSVTEYKFMTLNEIQGLMEKGNVTIIFHEAIDMNDSVKRYKVEIK